VKGGGSAKNKQNGETDDQKSFARTGRFNFFHNNLADKSSFKPKRKIQLLATIANFSAFDIKNLNPT